MYLDFAYVARVLVTLRLSDQYTQDIEEVRGLIAVFAVIAFGSKHINPCITQTI